MRKTVHTLLTAALFATANLSAMPAVAEDGNSLSPQNEAEQAVSCSQASDNERNSDELDITGITNDTLKATSRSMSPVYGPPPTTTVAPIYGPPPTTTMSSVGKTTTTTTTATTTKKLINTTTTTVQPVYGTSATQSMTNTTATTEKIIKKTTTTTNDWDKIMTTTTTTPQPVYGPPLHTYVGDVNLDGSVDSFDVLAVRKMLVKGVERYSDGYMEAYYGDMNNDGKLNVADLILLQKYLLGKVTKDELQKEYNYYYGSHDVDIEQITTAPDNNTTTTTTITYDPRQDIIVTLYGIAPSVNVKEQAANPNKTTETTAEQPETEEK